ncbi:MAG: polysaccharide biosynthesis C-terminal domain-containing protein, partial [Duncaniella sp.]|nr:polysaccharide biosynthesis C-terminal domain-containing protein [Duncaniella sp.]
LTNLMGIQILYPMDKVRLVILSVSGGAVMNLLLNFLLIPSLGAVGAAVSTFIAELTVLFLQIVLGRKYYPFRISALINHKVIIATGVMGLAVYVSRMLTSAYLTQLIVGLSVGLCVYSATLWMLRDTVIIEIVDLVKTKIKSL